MSSWHEIWEKKPDDETATSTLSSLLSADGYDTLAAITPKAWTEHVHRIASRTALRESDSVFDVGCGAGAFLWPFREKGQPVGGLDYSSRQIDRARAAMPEVADFTVGEALTLADRPTYDAVIACGTFLYFQDLPYAEGVLRRMAAKAERTMAILDLPDLAKKEEILRWRERALGQETYRLRYAGLSHLYYAKEWFDHLLQQMNVTYAIEDQLFEGYNHSPFRFNVFAWKE
jgi:ubiquinone/menaquinone biosynthesis C-methylase UbiE